MTNIAFFNNKGGVGKTSLVFHLSWMYSKLGFRTVAADLDPQANLSTMFLDEDRLDELWPEGRSDYTALSPIQPLLDGVGGIGDPHLEAIEDIALLVGDLALSGFEDELSQQWSNCADGNERAFRVISAFYEILERAKTTHGADVTLMDVGPNLGAINRAALIAADYFVIPLAPDLFSIKGLQNLAPSLRKWRTDWQRRLEEKPANLRLPKGTITPIGYVAMQHSARYDRPVKAYARWADRIPSEYRRAVLEETPGGKVRIEDDPHCLALLKHFRSLMPMAMERHKPIFDLKPADGAFGGHVSNVQECYRSFKNLAEAIAQRCDLSMHEHV